MNWLNKSNYIFDIDGTLYSQKKVRKMMALRLTKFYIFRPHKWNELYSLYYFRKLREKYEHKNKSINDLYILVNKKSKLSVNVVSQTINKWMFIEPLDLLKRFMYKDVVDFANFQKAKGKTIIFYSDYSAITKLKALGINYNYVFVSGENDLIEQKPSLADMQTILKLTKINPAETLYIGDRDDKDMVSANYVGIEYCDIDDLRKKLMNYETEK